MSTKNKTPRSPMSKIKTAFYDHEAGHLVWVMDDTGETPTFWDRFSNFFDDEVNDDNDDAPLTAEEAAYFNAMLMRNDANIDEARYPDPVDRVMARYDEASDGNLPSDQQLEQLGVCRMALARHLRDGMTATKFTRALKHGLQVDGFNKRSPLMPAPMEELLDCFLQDARARKRVRRPENRALSALYGETI